MAKFWVRKFTDSGGISLSIWIKCTRNQFRRRSCSINIESKVLSTGKPFFPKLSFLSRSNSQPFSSKNISSSGRPCLLPYERSRAKMSPRLTKKRIRRLSTWRLLWARADSWLTVNSLNLPINTINSLSFWVICPIVFVLYMPVKTLNHLHN